MLDDLAELRTFERILTLGSLSAAARDMGVGLAVVSKRLAALERRAGVRLVNRTTRKLSPTEDGLALLAHTERMLDELAAAEARLASGREAPQGILRVSSSISFGRIHLVPTAAALVGLYPGLDIQLQLDDRLIDMIEARIDIAIRIGQPRDSDAIVRKLMDSWRILVAAPAYLDRRGRPAAPGDLAGHDVLRYDPAAGPWRLEGPGGALAEIQALPRLSADNGDAVVDWALAGCGVAMKSSIEVTAHLAAGRLERVLPDWRSAPAPIYALLPSGRHLPTKTRVFLDAIAARLKAVGVA
jgi:LysR family transcriptional activator of dmlA